jgi:Ca2+-binding RTX toxin-like protein
MVTLIYSIFWRSAMKIKYFSAISTSAQRLVFEAINDGSYSWFPSIDGTALSRFRLFGTSPGIIFWGNNLTENLDGSVSGTVTGIDIRLLSDDLVKITDINNADMDALNKAANEILDVQNRLSIFDANFIAAFDALDPDNAATVTGSNARDVIEGSAFNDILKGRNANDNFISSWGADAVDGGGGRKDFWVGKELPAGIVANIEDGFVSKDVNGLNTDSIVGIEGIVGTNFDDLIIGDAKVNFLHGCDGEDEIFGRDGNDKIYGGGGNDSLLWWR